MSARFVVADVFDGLASIEDGSVDLVVTSPPFLALRSYLPADHPDKGKEIGSEPTPAEFIDVMLAVTAELRRVLAPHGSICVELGDTYAGSGGAGGDYNDGSLRDGQPKFNGSAKYARTHDPEKGPPIHRVSGTAGAPGGPGWPLAKSKTLIPELYRIALAYGINPLTGAESPAGRWRIRNVVTWCRPNPPVGALGDKWRPATSDVVVACLSDKRYWDDIATRKPGVTENGRARGPKTGGALEDHRDTLGAYEANSAGAPLLDYWEIPPGGYPGSHYAVYPPELVVPLVGAMCPERVCRTCGEPSRRIVENIGPTGGKYQETTKGNGARVPGTGDRGGSSFPIADVVTLGWSDCGHDDYRPGLILDPFAGSGTTLAVATGHGYDAIGIDLDSRNLDLARERVGFFLDEGAHQ